MAQLYFRNGLHDRPVRFEHFFRSYPDYGDHQAGYCVAAGLGPFAQWTTTVHARSADVDALRGHRWPARRAAVRRRLLRVVRRHRLRRVAHRGRPRGTGRPPQHPDHRRRGSAGRGPAAGDAAAQPAQLRHAHRHQGGTGRRGIARASDPRVRDASGRRRGCRCGVARGHRRRRRLDVQRGRRLRARPHAGRHPRPLHGPAVHRPRRRASRPRSTPTPTPIPTTRCCSSTPSTRWAAGSPTPSPRSSDCAVPGTSRWASASTPATSPTSPCSRRASSTGPGSPTP